MRVALLTTSYPERDGDAAGLFVQCEALRLAREGHDVHVLAPGHPEPAVSGHGSFRRAQRAVLPPVREPVRDGALSLWGLGGGELFGWPGALQRVRQSPLRALGFVGFAARARLALRRIVPQRLIAHFVVPCGYPLAIATRGALEVVLHGSDARLVCALPLIARTHIARALLARGAELRFSSESLREQFIDALSHAEAGAIARCARVSPPEMAVPAFIDQHHRQSGPGEAWVACGRLIASKRVDRVIREAGRRGARLTVVGDGPERVALEALAKRVWPATRFTGQLPHREALAWIAAADRLVHLSDLEGAPSVIREARALGVPVLASAAGDVPKWAESDPGITLFRSEVHP